MKVKRESEVTQSCLTLSDPMDHSLPGSSVHGIFQTRVLEWAAIAFSKPFELDLEKRHIVLDSSFHIRPLYAPWLTLLECNAYQNTHQCCAQSPGMFWTAWPSPLVGNMATHEWQSLENRVELWGCVGQTKIIVCVLQGLSGTAEFKMHKFLGVKWRLIPKAKV